MWSTLNSIVLMQVDDTHSLVQGDLFSAVLGAVFIDSGGNDLVAARSVYERSQQGAGHAAVPAGPAVSVPAPTSGSGYAALPAGAALPAIMPAQQPVKLDPGILQHPQVDWSTGASAWITACVLFAPELPLVGRHSQRDTLCRIWSSTFRCSVIDLWRGHRQGQVWTELTGRSSRVQSWRVTCTSNLW